MCALTGAMQLVPLEQLLRLMQTLEPYLQDGKDRLISPDDEVLPCHKPVTHDNMQKSASKRHLTCWSLVGHVHCNLRFDVLLFMYRRWGIGHVALSPSHRVPDPQADSEDSTAALLAAEATVACLHVLACEGMPPQLYREDLIDCILGHLKACLLSNVLPFHDARLCRAHRPQLLDAGRSP